MGSVTPRKQLMGLLNELSDTQIEQLLQQAQAMLAAASPDGTAPPSPPPPDTRRTPR